MVKYQNLKILKNKSKNYRCKIIVRKLIETDREDLKSEIGKLFFLIETKRLLSREKREINSYSQYFTSKSIFVILRMFESMFELDKSTREFIDLLNKEYITVLKDKNFIDIENFKISDDI